MRGDVEFLSGPLSQGRGRGSEGHYIAATYIADRFKEEGLVAFDEGYIQRFPMNDTRSDGKNIIAIMPGLLNYPVSKYIIVGAHYDHLGTIDGKLYPGADSNASGVAALLAIAEHFKFLRSINAFWSTSIIFVAFDCCADDRAGARHLFAQLESGELHDPICGNSINVNQIEMMVDIDQIGSTLSPLKEGERNFVIAIGGNSRQEQALNLCNLSMVEKMHIGRTYYGSNNFTRLFYRLGNRRIFIDNGIPTVYFTSGITDLTNSTDDTAEMLDYPILEKRVELIGDFIEEMM